MPRMPRTRILALTLTCAGLLLPAAAADASPKHPRASWSKSIATAARKAAAPKAHAHKAQDDCADADLMPDGTNDDRIRAAILCLHNVIRTQHDLPALRANVRLRDAAEGHSQNMVSRGFFDHTTPNGVTMVDRILHARYTSRNQAWTLGENLAWATGTMATPRGVVKMWMDSPGHRANILKRAYREIGVGVVTGTPTGSDRGATYTADFGVVRR
jgi:uncharacterized protein YkwD